jgi:hypothetical protein
VGVYGEAGIEQAWATVEGPLKPTSLDPALGSLMVLLAHGAVGADADAECLERFCAAAGRVLEAVGPKDHRLVADAFGLLPSFSVSVAKALLASDDAAVRCLGIEVIGYRRMADDFDSVPDLVSILRSRESSPDVATSAARALARLAEVSAGPLAASRASRAPVSVELVEAALCLGETLAVEALRKVLSAGAVASPVELARCARLLAFAGSKDDATLLWQVHCRTPEVEGVVSALGCLGYADSLQHLHSAVDQPRSETARAEAAAALTLITGANPGAGNAEGQEPCVDPRRWSEWFARHRNRFTLGSRYRGGKTLSAAHLVATLAEPRGSYALRNQAAIELSIAVGKGIIFECDWPLPKQRQQLKLFEQCAARAASAPVRGKSLERHFHDAVVAATGRARS